MYSAVLFAHAWIRWGVLLAGLALLAFSGRAWRAGAPWDGRLDRLRVAFLAVLDTQVALGLLLYLYLSPIPRAALADPGVALGDAVLRFYSIEHAFGMLAGLALAHGGLARFARRAPEAGPRRAFVTTALWLVVTLVSIPWPFAPYGRPLLRL